MNKSIREKALKIFVLTTGLVGLIMSFVLIYPALRADRIILEIQKINHFMYILKGISHGKNYFIDTIEIRINEPASAVKRVTFQYGELGLIQLEPRTPHSYVISTENLSLIFDSQQPFSFLFEFDKKIEQPKFSKCFVTEANTKKPIACKIAQEWYDNFSNATIFLVSLFLSALIGGFFAGVVYLLVKRLSKPKKKGLTHLIKPNPDR